MRVMLVFLAAFLWCYAVPVRADEPRVSIGPGMVTLSEVAAALSVGSHQVEAAADVQDSAAFVRIKDRPWSQARNLLCRGLDVVLKEKKGAKDAWFLTYDPDVKDREETWRRLLARNMRSYILAQLPEQLKLAQQSPEQLQARAAEIKSELDTLETQGQKNSAKHREEQAAYDAALSATFWGAQERLCAAWMTSDFPGLSHVQQAAEAGWAAWLFPSSRMPADLLAPVVEKLARGDTPMRYDRAMGVIQLNLMPGGVGMNIGLYLLSGEEGTGFASIRQPNAGSMNVPYSLVDEDQAASDMHPPWIEWMFRGRRPINSRSFDGLGDAAIAWLQQQREQTAAFLKSSRAKIPIPTPRRWPDSLSQWVEAWCKLVDGEVVMELCPGGEVGGDLESSDTRKPAYSLADLHTGPSAGSFGAWSLVEDNGTLLVKNQLAFLYRARKRPVASLVRLLRNLTPVVTKDTTADATTARSEAISLNALPFPTVRDYVLDVTSAAHGYWSFPQIFADRYRGFNLRDLDHAVPTVYVWDRLSPDDRLRVVAGAGPMRTTATIPLTKIGLADQRIVGRSLQAWGHWIWGNLARDPAELARSETLTIQVTSLLDKPGNYRLRFDLDPNLWGGDCEILWSPR